MSGQLRPEARPAKWGELDRVQREAVKRVARMIGEALDELPLHPQKRSAPDEHSPLPESRSLRTSRIAFLSGERGTGKTTVLESIIGYTLEPASKGLETEDPDFSDCLRKMHQRVVWLDYLDMEPIQQITSLLMAILVRIEESVWRYADYRTIGEGEAGDSYPLGLLESTDESSDPLLAFKRLQTNIALGWNSNLDERKGQLDPDSFAIELMRGEQARLSLDRDLDRVLDDLASSAFRATQKRSPLFVLPVDDLDLNPRSCLQLLRLLRLISTRRLFIVLVGDENLTELVLNLHSSNDLARLLIDVRDLAQVSVSPAEIAGRAGNVATNAMRKLLPPAQRVRLEAMTVAEALNFRPLGAGPDATRLHQILAKCLVHSETPLRMFEKGQNVSASAFVSLRDLMLARGLQLDAQTGSAKPPLDQRTDRDMTDLDVKNAAYSGIGFLRASPRRLADLWFFLKQIADSPSQEDNASEVIDHFAVRCRLSLLGAPALGPQERDLVRYAIERNDNREWELHHLPVMVRSDTEVGRQLELVIPQDVRTALKWLEQKRLVDRRRAEEELAPQAPGSATTSTEQLEPSETQDRKGSPELSLVLSRAVQWRFEASLSSLSSEQLEAQAPQVQAPPLDRETASELTVLHDLLALGRGSRFASPLLGRFDGSWARTEWSYGELQKVSLAWPVAPCQSFWELDLFLNAWNQAFTKLSLQDTNNQEAATWMAFVWISAGTALVDGELRIQLGAENGRPEWNDLVKRIEGLAGRARRRDPSSQRAAQWLTSVALLLMPESGLPAAAQRPFFRSSELRSLWAHSRLAIQRRRAERLAQFVKNDMADLAEALYAQTSRADGQIGFPEEHHLPKLLVYRLAGVTLEKDQYKWQLNPWGPWPPKAPETLAPTTPSPGIAEMHASQGKSNPAEAAAQTKRRPKAKRSFARTAKKTPMKAK
jgi:hypothetical protein